MQNTADTSELFDTANTPTANMYFGGFWCLNASQMAIVHVEPFYRKGIEWESFQIMIKKCWYGIMQLKYHRALKVERK